MRCEYNSDKTCDESRECEKLSVSCDECKFISEEGDCDNSESKNYCRFMDGLTTCCSLFKGKV